MYSLPLSTSASSAQEEVCLQGQVGAQRKYCMGLAAQWPDAHQSQPSCFRLSTPLELPATVAASRAPAAARNPLAEDPSEQLAHPAQVRRGRPVRRWGARKRRARGGCWIPRRRFPAQRRSCSAPTIIIAMQQLTCTGHPLSPAIYRSNRSDAAPRILCLPAPAAVCGGVCIRQARPLAAAGGCPHRRRAAGLPGDSRRPAGQVFRQISGERLCFQHSQLNSSGRANACTYSHPPDDCRPDRPDSRRRHARPGCACCSNTCAPCPTAHCRARPRTPGLRGLGTR